MLGDVLCVCDQLVPEQLFQVDALGACLARVSVTGDLGASPVRSGVSADSRVGDLANESPYLECEDHEQDAEQDGV